MPLAGRTALVTGASRGIGAAVAEALASAGARVVVTARTPAVLDALARRLGQGAIALPADLAQRHGASVLAHDTTTMLGGAPDLLVHAAGTFPMAPFAETDDGAVDDAFAVNAVAPLRLTRAFLPAMLARGSGHVIIIGSVADRHVFPGNAAYAATKHAVRAMHEALRAETRGTGIRASLVSPSATDTTIWDPYRPDESPTLPSRADMLKPEAVAQAVLWVATQADGVNVDEVRLSKT
jgi:NADP-dependent 3-hydroxy acid dehydrogenase YdfG